MNHRGTENTEKDSLMAAKSHKNPGASEALNAPIGARWIFAEPTNPFAPFCG
jgi:hypothetical protein